MFIIIIIYFMLMTKKKNLYYTVKLSLNYIICSCIYIPTYY